jgi:hypothetical protein
MRYPVEILWLRGAKEERREKKMRVFRPTYRDRSGRKRKTSKFYIEFKDNLELIRRLPAFPDKRQSEALGRQIEKLVACKLNNEQDPQLARWLENIPAKMRERFVKIGLIDSTRAAASKLLKGHIEDFGQSLIDKGDTRKQAQMTVSRVNRIVKDCKFTT